ncbi:MAG TPA: MEKHLA domain-containing protein [Nitrospiria bacterium]|nr:MEKHLA domain-containing protein [Nitrospiria bacterium]
MNAPIFSDPLVVRHSQRLIASYRHWTGRPLIPDDASTAIQARMLFHHPSPVLSHNAQADPILNYGNAAALHLWDMTWDEFTKTPSRLTAEPVAREERARLLAEAAKRGYLDQYRGIRISRTGRRFVVEGAVVWTVLDESGVIVGQAATFDRWTYVTEGRV